MSFINICRDNTDPFYRYKMPPIQSKVEGRGNGIKTVIVNLSEVSRALGRPPAYVIKYFGSELGALTAIQEDQDRYLVNGTHDANELQDSLDGFINKFVLCGNCKNPETQIEIKGRDHLQRDCKACGHITDIDPRHKLCSYILKNPPAGAKDKKGKKSATATANVVGGGKSISDIAQGQDGDLGGDEGEENDDDDALTKKINAEAAALAQVEIKDDEWAVDMSQEAIEARARALNTGALGADSTLSKFNELGDWLLEECKEGKEDLPSDVEIYKKIVDLDIVQKPETVQVLSQCLFDENIVEQLDEHQGLLAKLIVGDEDYEKAFLGGLERFFGIEKPDLIPLVPKVLVKVYNNDLISEEVIVNWGSKVSKKYVPKDISKKVRKAAKPFIEWLKNAEEESDDE
ncbi:Eukaryotic translation initiation factor 5A-1 [Scheffersomyces spartinae]|uniref:Eukaryotic translation initiation factor 5A-1 n=1 Tax=Scheffersomyces spartinae TaxID=45513 RepID=A0A9P7VC91_9ASCO|nr:Eukaryotic translation initiation factor 5A-1 [Scheffersomyces spartinae]KAG7195400.1 Eukaryotic translation initiation factor 5A-1 [Scheffersomyces spartinae]